MVRLDGTADLPRELLGNKGFGIDAMCRLGLPVPPAFGITTAVGADFLRDPDGCLDGVWSEVCANVRWLEQQCSRTFGGRESPLLVSVRSGAAQSLPGMLDSVLDVGIDDGVEAALAAAATPGFAKDTRDRFRRMYRRIVLDGDEAGSVPDDVYAQLRSAIEAVFASWRSPRATAYRNHHGLDDLGGTAVVVQAMVFGNMARNSGAGVLFTRNPMTGAAEPFGEWRPGGQGEDVVSGTHDVEPIATLRTAQPRVHQRLLDAADTLERVWRDVQDVEFTVEDGNLWLLQTRVAKRSAQAAVRLALAFLDEGLIDEAEALRRVTPAQVRALLTPSVQPETRLAATLLATGLPACPGVASGTAYTDVDEALDAADRGEDVILVRPTTTPDDVHGMVAALGIVTETGGAASHAAIVSREIGRPAVVGCGVGAAAALAGRAITVDGTEGEVRQGILETSAWSEADTPDLRRLTALARTASPLRAHDAGAPFPVLGAPTEAAVRAAMIAGHVDVVTTEPLIAMLTAVQIGEAGAG
ncbi:MAG: pyruvate, phosphate dikinase [Mycobacterium sp.]